MATSLDARTIFVTNVAPTVTEDELWDLFNRLANDVERITRQYDADTQQIGYSIVFLKPRSAQLAVQYLDGVKFKSLEGLSVTSQVYFKQSAEVENGGDDDAADGGGGGGASAAQAEDDAAPPPSAEELEQLPHNRLVPPMYRVDPLLVRGVAAVSQQTEPPAVVSLAGDAPEREDTLSGATLVQEFRAMQERLAAICTRVQPLFTELGALQQQYRDLTAVNPRRVLHVPLPAELSADPSAGYLPPQQQQQLLAAHPLLRSAARAARTLTLPSFDTKLFRALDIVSELTLHFGPVSRFCVGPPTALVVDATGGQSANRCSLSVEFADGEAALAAAAVLADPEAAEAKFRAVHSDALLAKRPRREGAAATGAGDPTPEELQEMAQRFLRLFSFGTNWRRGIALVPL